MKNLIHISKIKHKNNKELEVYYSMDDDCFEYYHFEDGVCELVDPYELDYIPEEYELDYDDDINEYNLNPKTKKHQKLKTTLKRLAATIAAGITITSAYPKILEVLDFTIMKSTTTFTTADLVDENTSVEDFKVLFNESIQSNNEFTQEEKDIISSGYQKFLDDWGYLLDETQKEYILYKAQNVKVFEKDIKNENISGRYIQNITVEDRDKIDVTAHEAIHTFSDHGATIGTQSIFLGQAINESLTSTINVNYITDDTTYEWEKLMTFLIEQLVGTETIIKFYATRDTKIDYLIKAIKENCPGATTLDTIKFIATMDLASELDKTEDCDKETLEKLQESAFEQYKRFFELKNGIKFEDSLLHEIGNCNVLDKEVTLEIMDDLKSTLYTVPRELLNKPKTYDISQYYTEIKYVSGTAGTVLNSIASEQEKLKAKSKQELIELVEKRFKANPDLDAKFQSMKTYIKNWSIPKDSQDINSFVVLALNTMLSQETDSKKLACIIKDYLFSIEQDKVAKYNNAIINQLKKLNLTEVLYYYSYTTIYWNLESTHKEVSKEFEELSDCYEYKFIPGECEGCLIVRVPENKIPYSVNCDEIKAYKIPADSKIYEYYENIIGKGEGNIYTCTLAPDLKIEGPVKLISDKSQILEETATIKM